MSITVRINKRNIAVPLDNNIVRKLIRKVFRHFKVRNAVVEIEIVGDYRIKNLNYKFLKRNRITDCISFDLSEKNRYLYLIVVNAQKAKREAKKRRIKSQTELLLYIVHGLLHNLGFNDNNKHAAALMHKTEASFLHQIGDGPVYNN